MLKPSRFDVRLAECPVRCDAGKGFRPRGECSRYGPEAEWRSRVAKNPGSPTIQLAPGKCRIFRLAPGKRDTTETAPQTPQSPSLGSDSSVDPGDGTSSVDTGDGTDQGIFESTKQPLASISAFAA
jgi:hypothetical protein